VERLEKRAARLAVIPPVQIQNKIPMIRIAFETRTNSEDPHRPDAWRREAAAKLREIAKRITAGEPMPLILFDRDGNFIGKARELSYRPEPPRQLATKPPHGL
jgi:hypothetical protein